MKEDGMAIKWSAWDLQDDPRVKKYAMLESSSDDSDDDGNRYNQLTHSLRVY